VAIDVQKSGWREVSQDCDKDPDVSGCTLRVKHLFFEVYHISAGVAGKGLRRTGQPDYYSRIAGNVVSTKSLPFPPGLE
jgi:hypothetical protein